MEHFAGYLFNDSAVTFQKSHKKQCEQVEFIYFAAISDYGAKNCGFMSM